MRVWLDDVRPMAEGYDVHAKTARDAIDLLKTGLVTAISLDHDLGPDEAGTGYDVAKFVAESAYNGQLRRLEWAIHSANPVGRANMHSAMTNADKFWGYNGD